jgi:hypothetical protein
MHGGGVVQLRVAGALIHDGILSARGRDNGGRTSAGGSIRITAGTLAGTGTIDAGGGNAYRGGGGGRIAVMLTRDNEFGSVTMRACGGSTDRLDSRAAAGTVYTQRAVDRDGHGVVTVDNDGRDADAEKTWLPGARGGGEDLSETSWAVQRFGEVQLVTNATLAALTLSANGFVDLNGYTLTVGGLKIADAKIEPDTYLAAELGTLVSDSSDDDTGRMVVLSPVPVGPMLFAH